MAAASQSANTEDRQAECPLFNLPPHLRSRRLDLKPVGEVLTADVMENLQPPPEDAASNPDAYYRHLAEWFQRLEPDMSVAGIVAAQATADQLWRVLHPLPRLQRKLTVGDRVAAARRVRHPDPPAAAPAPAAPEVTAQRRGEIVKEILRLLDAADRRRRAAAAPLLAVEAGITQSEGRGLGVTAEVEAPPQLSPSAQVAAREQATAQDAGPGGIAAPTQPREADASTPLPAAEPHLQQIEPIPATMAEFIARGDHGPRGQWLEPNWPDDIKAALRPPPLESGESLSQYLQMFKCFTDPRKLSTLREWQANQDFTDSKWREVRRAGRASAPNMQIYGRT